MGASGGQSRFCSTISDYGNALHCGSLFLLSALRFDRLPAEMIRVLILTSTVGFFARTCWMKAFFAQVVSIIYLAIFLYARPYRRGRHFVTQAIAMTLPALSLAWVLAGGWEDADELSVQTVSADSEYDSIGVLMLHVVVLILPVLTALCTLVAGIYAWTVTKQGKIMANEALDVETSSIVSFSSWSSWTSDEEDDGNTPTSNKDNSQRKQKKPPTRRPAPACDEDMSMRNHAGAPSALQATTIMHTSVVPGPATASPSHVPRASLAARNAEMTAEIAALKCELEDVKRKAKSKKGSKKKRRRRSRSEAAVSDIDSVDKRKTKKKGKTKPRTAHERSRRNPRRKPTLRIIEGGLSPKEMEILQNASAEGAKMSTAQRRKQSKKKKKKKKGNKKAKKKRKKMKRSSSAPNHLTSATGASGERLARRRESLSNRLELFKKRKAIRDEMATT